MGEEVYHVGDKDAVQMIFNAEHDLVEGNSSFGVEAFSLCAHTDCTASTSILCTSIR